VDKRVPILLVEDDFIDVKTVRRAFKKNKVINPLHVCNNGEEALAYLRREGNYADKDKSPRPGLILLDLNMPVMNGIELLQIIKNDDELKHIPVVVLTTSKDENDRVETFNLSVAGYIIKPVDFDRFLEAVKIINLYWSLSELCPDSAIAI
jgi:CheY-like chemotaxis protein